MSDLLYFIFVQQSAWFASVISLFMMWKMGSLRWWAPYVGIFGQVFWALLGIYTQQWGLLPAVVCYSFVHGRNAWKWRHLRTLDQSQNPSPGLSPNPSLSPSPLLSLDSPPPS